MKTISISEDAHKAITDKQEEIYKKYKVKVRIFDLVSIIIIDDIDNAEKLLGLQKQRYDNRIFNDNI